MVIVTADGLEVMRDRDLLATVRWSEVRKIIAYKYDLFAYDEICIGFLKEPDADGWLEISEEWKGFREAIRRMEEIFPSIPKDWFNEIMVPAFERKETVIYQSS